MLSIELTLSIVDIINSYRILSNLLFASNQFMIFFHAFKKQIRPWHAFPYQNIIYFPNIKNRSSYTCIRRHIVISLYLDRDIAFLLIHLFLQQTRKLDG